MSVSKKLPCGHIFHTSCLRSWFQRQQTCPTCRLDVLRPPTPPASTTPAPAPAAQAGAVPAPQQPPQQQPPPRESAHKILMAACNVTCDDSVINAWPRSLGAQVFILLVSLHHNKEVNIYLCNTQRVCFHTNLLIYVSILFTICTAAFMGAFPGWPMPPQAVVPPGVQPQQQQPGTGLISP